MVGPVFPFGRVAEWRPGGFRDLMKQAVIALVLIGAASVFAHLPVVAQTYYPVVRVTSPEGLAFTAVHEPTSDREACGVANETFLAPFKAMCDGCRVETARCERELEGLAAALSDGKSIPHHRVLAPGLHVAIEGPDAAAGLGCDYIARGLIAQGIPSVACLPPLRPTKS